MTIAGHGRIRHSHLDDPRHLVELAGTTPKDWGAYSSSMGGRRWTLYSPDPDYTAMFTPAARTLKLEFEVLAEKFPGWNSEWRIN